MLEVKARSLSIFSLFILNGIFAIAIAMLQSFSDLGEGTLLILIFVNTLCVRLVCSKIKFESCVFRAAFGWVISFFTVAFQLILLTAQRRPENVFRDMLDGYSVVVLVVGAVIATILEFSLGVFHPGKQTGGTIHKSSTNSSGE